MSERRIGREGERGAIAPAQGATVADIDQTLGTSALRLQHSMLHEEIVECSTCLPERRRRGNGRGFARMEVHLGTSIDV